MSFFIFCEVDGYIDGVFYVEEITNLFAVFVVWVVAFEELDFAGLEDLVVGFVDEAAHIGFMVFVGAEDVEVFKADDGA